MAEKEVTSESLAKLTTNIWAFWTLVAGIKLDVFDHIEEWSTAKEVADKLKIEENPVERLLNAFVAMELLEKEEGRYRNLPVSNKFLLKDSPDYFGDFILMYEGASDNWRELDKAIKTNKTAIEIKRERFEKPFFTRAMHNNAKGPARKLSEIFDFSNKEHLLDIGAGAGTFSIILTNQYPDLKATAIEQEKVCEAMNEYIKKEGDPKKIDVVGGDFLKIDFPKHDVALFGQIFHSNSLEQNKLLIKKVFDNLEENGSIIITEFLMNEDKTGPLFPALFSLNMLHQAEGGDAFTFSQVRNWLEEAGFKNVEQKHLVGPHTAIIAQK